jgi:hypothetical protein
MEKMKGNIPKERTGSMIEEILSHNSLLKQQKMENQLNLGKFVNKDSQEYNGLGYSFKSAFNIPFLLDRVKTRKVPRVDCNYDTVIESKVLSAKSKKNKQ